MDKEGKIREDWLINNGNIFNLPEMESLALFTIQVEILRQIEGENFSSIKDYLNFKIDVAKEVHLTNELSIVKILNENLGIELNHFGDVKMGVSLILGFMKIWLAKKYLDDSNDLLLTADTYRKQFNTIKNNFIESNIDTDENDFIEIELGKCDELIQELNKPIYNEINAFGDVLDTPDNFKKNLLNSIDKRIKFLRTVNGEVKETLIIKKEKESITYNDNRQYNSSQVVENNDGIISQEKSNITDNDDTKEKTIWEKIKFFLDFFNSLKRFISIIVFIILLITGYNVLDMKFFDSISSPIIETSNVNPAEKFVLGDSLKLPYLDNVTILDNGLFLRYNFNDLKIGGVNIDSMSINVRTKKGEIGIVTKNDGHIKIHSIHKFPFIEIEYKGEYYSIEVCGEYLKYYYKLNKVQSTTMKLKKYIEID
jgi:hypothetical protein